jgi:hypothetical protein
MLFVALLTIGLLALVQNIGSQIKRDREEEMIHRGVQYSRAVRRYFKKFGRYPNRIEELENANNIRFLRKRYKDPITGKDFKPLHITDVQLSFVSGAPVSGAPGGGLPPGGLDASSPGGTNAAPSAAVGPGQDATTSQGPQPGDQSGPNSGDQTGGPVTGTASGQSSGLSVRSGQTQSNDAGPAGAVAIHRLGRSHIRVTETIGGRSRDLGAEGRQRRFPERCDAVVFRPAAALLLFELGVFLEEACALALVECLCCFAEREQPAQECFSTDTKHSGERSQLVIRPGLLRALLNDKRLSE